VAQLEGEIRANGSVSKQVNLTAFAILALRSAGVGPPAGTVTWLTRQQDADGGFNFATRGGTSDIDDTGAALEALGGASPASARAVRFLDAHENRDGGFPTQPGAGSNAQSTAWAVQGLLASGANMASLGRPLGYLRGLIASDGHVRYSRGNDETPVWVTAQALMALEGKPLPLAPVTSTGRASHRHRATVARAHATAIGRKRNVERRESAQPASPVRRLVAGVGIAEAVALAPVS
jgi:energy-coupling factor transport system substrate-specific component